MSRRILYLVNPISGARNRPDPGTIVRKLTEAAGFHFEIYPSVASGDYRFLLPLIREGGFTDVVIAGGDGTINKAVGCLKDSGVRFGILPLGSGNGLALSAGIPKNLEKALNVVFTGTVHTTDAYLVNGEFACMLCGLGFDAQVAHDFSRDPKRGLATYVRKTVSNFFTAHTWPFELICGSRDIRVEAFFISIANSNQFGNNFTIAPRASLRDGLLDIVVMTQQNKLSVLVQAMRQFGGFNRLQKLEMINEKASLLYFQTDSIDIMNPALAPMHIDGDPAASPDRLSIRLMKDCFQLIYPSR
jgi:YegS/Rv2252/BmrU family lipid kinase